MYNRHMPKILTTYPPLQQLCLNAGVDADAIAARVKTITGEEIGRQAVVAFLRRGTRNVDYLEAIAQATKLPLHVVSEAGKKDNKRLLQNVK